MKLVMSKTLTLMLPALFTLLAALPLRAEVVVGQPAPRADLELLDGKVLPARHGEGKVVVQMFWATWCPICVRELPQLQKLYNTYRHKGLEIVALSIDDDKGDVADFWWEKGYTFPVAMRSEAVKLAYGRITGTPTLYVIDRKGITRLKQVGALPYERLEAIVRSLL